MTGSLRGPHGTSLADRAPESTPHAYAFSNSIGGSAGSPAAFESFRRSTSIS
jgi:hypothetical protein